MASKSGTSYTVTGLTPNTSYTFGVSAVNPLGISTYSLITVSTTTLQVGNIYLIIL
ncbi:fibronectin type III domain-containing protein [Cohnella hongkongensis]|uniref:Fibronectin type III domain-containing protein n=1 Tax=Cohnella hongkongensis TaxID=178337 RepID=A0ABV9FIY0_9BACL